jgi:hypothetical protein
MKLVYNDSAPAEYVRQHPSFPFYGCSHNLACSYEAPNFVPLALEKQQWHFTTHEVNEKPDRTFVGAVESGHHSYVSVLCHIIHIEVAC